LPIDAGCADWLPLFGRCGRLEELTPTDDEELRALWQRTAEAALKAPAGWHGAAVSVPAQFLVLVRQVELLRRLEVEGMECKALLS
jgi:hypothetical protein